MKAKKAQKEFQKTLAKYLILTYGGQTVSLVDIRKKLKLAEPEDVLKGYDNYLKSINKDSKQRQWHREYTIYDFERLNRHIKIMCKRNWNFMFIEKQVGTSVISDYRDFPKVSKRKVFVNRHFVTIPNTFKGQK